MILSLLIASNLIVPVQEFDQRSWVDKLTSPGKGLCCSNNDGRRLDDVDWDNLGTITKDPKGSSGYRVRDDGEWIDVPNEVIVDGRNQDGIARVWFDKWWSNGVELKRMRCFLRGVEG